MESIQKGVNGDKWRMYKGEEQTVDADGSTEGHTGWTTKRLWT